MDINQHANEMLKLAAKDMHIHNVPMDLLHAAIGAAGEAGELLDAIKRPIFYGKVLDTINVIEEIGDMYWYLALACKAIHVEPSDVLLANARKLRARYPQDFTNEAALNRNLVNESNAIKGVA